MNQSFFVWHSRLTQDRNHCSHSETGETETQRDKWACPWVVSQLTRAMGRAGQRFPPRAQPHRGPTVPQSHLYQTTAPKAWVALNYWRVGCFLQEGLRDTQSSCRGMCLMGSDEPGLKWRARDMPKALIDTYSMPGREASRSSIL